VKGGAYGLSVVATFGGGNVQLQLLGPDGSTWLNVGSAITANGVVDGRSNATSMWPLCPSREASIAPHDRPGSLLSQEELRHDYPLVT
jgi:hypothetical protein